MSIETPTTDAEPGESGTVSDATTSDANEQDEATTSEAKPPEQEALPLDTVFEMLRNERRRRVLEYLEEESETTLSDLAEHIAARENDTTVRALSSQQRKRVYVGLYQCHLPKMDGTGIIDFDGDRGDVERTATADQLTPYLDVDDEGDEDRGETVPALGYVCTVAAGTLAYFAAGALGSAAWMLHGTVATTLLAVTTLALAHADVSF
jgi:DNA-binding transcriptional ArsR family regulator